MVSVPITGLYHDQHTPNPALHYIDAFYPFGGPNIDFSLRGNDGVHLNSAGAQKLTDLVVAALVAPPADATPPSTVTLSGTAPDSTKVVLNWTPATDTGNSGVWAYRVFRSDQPSPIATMDNPETPTYTDSTVASGTTYTYSVRAVDAAATKARAATWSTWGSHNFRDLRPQPRRFRTNSFSSRTARNFPRTRLDCPLTPTSRRQPLCTSARPLLPRNDVAAVQAIAVGYCCGTSSSAPSRNRTTPQQG